MPLVDPARSLLLVVDMQARLMAAIDAAEAVIANARRLVEAAGLLGVPILRTEQNPAGLGPTLPELAAGTAVAKMAFDATRAAGVLDALPEGHDVIATGCEAHICVLQTVVGLRAAGRRVFAVRDAVGSRRRESVEAGLARMAAHGAEIVTAEMVVFEWLASAEHPRFREAVKLIK
ncbi:isochorismatase family protein [Methylobacterium sp. NEAU 140]|uniref:isochorismatase family protein n=1 Tax=Methylobacterium sp. NEAU 140 TaxID=3064945 RepID=UPI002733E8AE|nr:isochorismatase family protein [Methylobacterium sp. NEAU 140]MDP4024144.1 isochorismatase family protein [Methylobacterium sp. NEAU 140]